MSEFLMDRSDFEHVFHTSSKLFGSINKNDDNVGVGGVVVNKKNNVERGDEDYGEDYDENKGRGIGSGSGSGGMSEIFPTKIVSNQFQNSAIMEDAENQNLYPTQDDYIITDEIEQVPTTEVDIFMTNVYKFFRARGLRNILITQIVNLLFVLFLVSFVIFLLVCVDISGLLSIHDPR